MSKRFAFGVLFALGFVCIGLLVAFLRLRDSRDSGELRAWNTYRGEVGGYSVEIDESDRGEGFRRIVHLRPSGSPSYVGITGHDYNDDGRWDRVFYCGYPEVTNGCNSFYIDPSGELVWEPCPADEDILEPFLLGELLFAEQELDQAMAAVHQPQFLTSTLVDWGRENG